MGENTPTQPCERYDLGNVVLLVDERPVACLVGDVHENIYAVYVYLRIYHRFDHYEFWQESISDPPLVDRVR